MRKSVLITAAGLLLIAAEAGEAHTTGVATGFRSGFLHPLSGLDHVLAMVAVGIWGVQLGRPAVWLLPVTFPLVMAFGGALGVRGVPIPNVEIGVAASALILGLLVAFAARLPIWAAAIVVGAFAIFHGHAHGTELPRAAEPLAFAIGFVLATGLLHALGISLGLLQRWSSGNKLLRFGGVAIALSGAFLLARVAA